MARAAVCLILERHHGLVAPAECRHPQQAALGLWQSHHGPVTVDRMPIRSEVPAASLWFRLRMAEGDGGLGWGCQPGAGKGQYQG